ncbi:serine hydrolase [Collinsella sp. WCA1-178-WT-3 (M2)]|nr:serine hydrolase [Collinsella sp. WCA1-178-WT-3 (M2)]MSS51315.1 serine hydrolase [Collinsella sp. WCA1-178-WT-3 (M1)]
MLLVYEREQPGDHVRNDASRDEHVPQHSSRYETKGTSSRGLADARIRVMKIAAMGMLTLAVIILGITAKTYASERTAHSDASTVQTQNKKVSKSKATASQTLSTASLKTRLSKADFNDIPSGDTVQTFSLVDDQIPVLEDESLAALQDTLDQAQELGDVGVVFYNLSSGKGVTYNADAEVYGASSYKALYVLYVCELLVETGQVSLDDTLGTYGGYSMGWLTVRDLIETSVVNSDNDSFVALRATFDQDGYEDWIAALGVEDEVALDSMSDFPTYCPRTSVKLWREMSEYLSRESETSQWLSGLLASTTRSFIRDGIADDHAMVRNKAGWISEAGCNATCDAGLIDVDGDTYIMSIMTSMPWSDRSSEAVAAIAKALYDTRAALA